VTREQVDILGTSGKFSSLLCGNNTLTHASSLRSSTTNTYHAVLQAGGVTKSCAYQSDSASKKPILSTPLAQPLKTNTLSKGAFLKL